MSRFAELLAEHVKVSPAEAALLEAHYELLEKWNKKLNLTAIRNLDDAVVRHYAESVFVAQRLPPANSVVDVGSGGGFPGIPISILHPNALVTLVESHQRKAVFLSEAARILKSEAISPHLHVLSSRIEDVRARFELLVARAINWEDFWPLGPKLAPQVALLLGAADVQKLLRDVNFSWSLPEKLPWGDNRYLLQGELKARST